MQTVPSSTGDSSKQPWPFRKCNPHLEKLYFRVTWPWHYNILTLHQNKEESLTACDCDLFERFDPLYQHEEKLNNFDILWKLSLYNIGPTRNSVTFVFSGIIITFSLNIDTQYSPVCNVCLCYTLPLKSNNVLYDI